MQYPTRSNIRVGIVTMSLNLLLINLIYAQGAGFACLFDSHGCDYTEVPPPPDEEPQAMLILNNGGATICLPYCSTEEDIIAAFQGWFDELIDPVTNCPSVRIALGFDGDVNGPEVLTEVVLTSTFGSNSFVYNMGQNVITGDLPTGQIRMPAPCGGAITYNLTVEADCIDDGTYEGTQGAALTLIVGKFRAPSASEPVVITSCESDTELNAEFQSWLNGLGGVIATQEEFLAYDGACFDPAGCNFNFSFDIRKNGQTVTQFCIILGERLQDCMKRQLNTLMDNRFRRCGGRIEVDMIHTSNNATCGQQTLMSQSFFEITTPQVTTNAPNNSELQFCTSDQDVLTAFQIWKDAFSFTTSELGCPHREEFYVSGSANPIDRASIDFTQFCGDTIEIDYRVINTGCFPGLNQPEQIVAQKVRTFILNKPTMFSYNRDYMICSTEPVGLDLLISPFIPNQDLKAFFYITEINANGLMPGNQNSQVVPNVAVGFDAIKHDAWLNTGSETLPVTYTIVPVIDCDSTDMDQSTCEGQPVDIVVHVKPVSCPDDIHLELMKDKTDTTFHYPQDLFCSNTDITYAPPSGTIFQVGTHPVSIFFSDQEICSFLIFVAERGVKTWFVDDSVGVAGNGTSWALAFDNLQDALDTAIADDIIWVADGVYYPTVEFYNGSDRSKNFYIDKDLKIYGGFKGNENELNQRNWYTNKTLLSGDLGILDNISDNAYNILYLAGNERLNSGFVLDGFCLTQSRGDGFNFAETRGGAMICDASQGDLVPQIRNCNFEYNYAEFGGAIYNFGAGNTCSPKIIQCLFTNNTADYGGALYNGATSSGICSPSIINTSFMFNLASESGSMMYNDASPGTVNPTLTNSIFSLNWQSSASPTQVFNSGATATFAHCILEHRNGNDKPTWATDGGNNHYVDPQVVSVLGNYRLSKPSPGIDAGTPDTSGLCIPLIDFEGNPRLNGTIDIGPYENPFTGCPEQIILDNLRYGPIDGTYEASQDITLSNDLQIGNTANVILNAPQVIVNETQVLLGSVINILNDGCDP